MSGDLRMKRREFCDESHGLRLPCPSLLRAGLVLLCLLIGTFPISAEENRDVHRSSWNPPKNLFETTGRASEAEVVTDPSGVVHVFWAYGAPDSGDAGSGQAIYYARLQDGKWSEPVDVLISPGDRVARMHSVAADAAGFLHVVWSGANAIFYSRAYSREAGSAGGWIAPAALTSGVPVEEPALAVGPADTLCAVWTQAGTGLMFVRSEDGGQNWSEPQVIFPAGGVDELARLGAYRR